MLCYSPVKLAITAGEVDLLETVMDRMDNQPHGEDLPSGERSSAHRPAKTSADQSHETAEQFPARSVDNLLAGATMSPGGSSLSSSAERTEFKSSDGVLAIKINSLGSVELKVEVSESPKKSLMLEFSEVPEVMQTRLKEMGEILTRDKAAGIGRLRSLLGIMLLEASKKSPNFHTSTESVAVSVEDEAIPIQLIEGSVVDGNVVVRCRPSPSAGLQAKVAQNLLNVEWINKQYNEHLGRIFLKALEGVQ